MLIVGMRAEDVDFPTWWEMDESALADSHPKAADILYSSRPALTWLDLGPPSTNRAICELPWIQQAMVAIYGGAGVTGVDTEATPLPSAGVSCVRMEDACPECSSLSKLPSFCALTSVCSVRTGREIRHITSRHPGDKRTRRDGNIVLFDIQLALPRQG